MTASIESRTPATVNPRPSCLVTAHGDVLMEAPPRYQTVFNGYANDEGDEITGEYLTTGPSLKQTGTWIVRKKKR